MESPLDNFRTPEDLMVPTHDVLHDGLPSPTNSSQSHQSLFTPPVNELHRASPIIQSVISTAASIPAPYSPNLNSVCPPISVSPNNSDDSVDNNSGGNNRSKNRRKRKPNKTQRMHSIDVTSSDLRNVDGSKIQNELKACDGNNIQSSLIGSLANLGGDNPQSTKSHHDALGENKVIGVDNYKSLESNLGENSIQNLRNLSDNNKTIEEVQVFGNDVDKIGSGESSEARQINNNVQASDRRSSGSRFGCKDDVDDCETIDKIAEMIAKTTNRSDVVAAALAADTASHMRTTVMNVSASNHRAASIESDLEKTLNGSMFQINCRPNHVSENIIPNTKCERTGGVLAVNDILETVNRNPCGVISRDDTKNRYEDVENKLEELFAGIEDDRPPNVDNNLISSDHQLSRSLDNHTQDPIDDTNSKGVKRGKSEVGDTDETPSTKRKRVVKRRRRGGAIGSKFKKTKMVVTSTPKGSNPKDLIALVAGGNNKNKGSILAREENHRGPFVHVRPDGEITVVNCPNGEDDTEKAQGKLKKLIPGQTSERNHIRGLHVSTLSIKYDADTRDVSWICVFCKMGPHKNGLGDLFGPYIMPTDCDEFQMSQSDPAQDAFKSKRTKQDMIQKYIAGKQQNVEKAGEVTASLSSTTMIGSSKKKKIQGLPKTPTPEQQPQLVNCAAAELKSFRSQADVNIFAGMSLVTDASYEVWVHEDCAVWASGVHIVGVRILGLESAVWGSTRHFCTVCSQNGAMLSCLQRGCCNQVHVPCAKLNDWSLNDYDFKSYCEAHRPADLMVS